MENTSYIISQIIKFLLPFLIGSLIFFSTVIAPNIFKNLDPKNARKFVRIIFPKLYLWSFIICLSITFLTFTKHLIFGLILLGISIGFIFSRQYLTKWINEISDQPKKTKSHQNKFLVLHTLSVFIFITQIILLIFIYFKF